MTTVSLWLAYFTVAGGLFMVVAPRPLLSLGRVWIDLCGAFWVLAEVVVRLLLGLCLFFAGLQARWPDFVQGFAIYVLLTIPAVLFLGRKGMERLLDWFESLSGLALRAVGLATAVLGVLLVRGL